MKSLRLVLALAFTLAVTLMAPAHAENQYRYWSFWQGSGSSTSTSEWQLASVGAGSVPAEQGLVQGWRFLTAGVDVGKDLAPRVAPDFDLICGSISAASEGNVQVALVIDYGLESDLGTPPPAPRSICVEIAAGEPSTMVLARAAEVREDAGFVCGLDQIPAEGCGEEVAVAEQTSVLGSENPVETANDSDEKWDLVANIVTTILGVVVFVMAWRRMMQQKALKRQAQTGESPSSDPQRED